MAGYVVILVTFPADLNLWVAPRMGDIDYQQLTLIQTLAFTLTGNLPEGVSFDALSRATPLDVMKTGLNNLATVPEIRVNPVMGDFGGRGWEWIGNFLAIGGLWLMIRKIIRWQIPLGVVLGLLGPFYLRARHWFPDLVHTPVGQLCRRRRIRRAHHEYGCAGN
jgi:electron transport complex protein RnfD